MHYLDWMLGVYLKTSQIICKSSIHISKFYNKQYKLLIGELVRKIIFYVGSSLDPKIYKQQPIACYTYDEGK